ncbi:MAG: hypothetical protein K5770_17735 [Lachnospiraceae bacterium]|nr:hypothetical protein [Lachnospiraceae bacterium]
MNAGTIKNNSITISAETNRCGDGMGGGICNSETFEKKDGTVEGNSISTSNRGASEGGGIFI